LPSAATATAVLGGNPGTLGAAVAPPAQTPRAATTIAAVAADTAGLARLSAARTQTVSNAQVMLGDD
jgi:hypothetical protein